MHDEAIHLVNMSNKDFLRLKDFIYVQCGINITDAKRTMLEARLQKRLRVLNLPSFSKYCDYLFSREGMEEEITPMIDLVTTNKTDFFRESAHFDYLTAKVIPELLRNKGLQRTVSVWSAGCSSGEEPYTLAMVLNELECRYIILATDISTRALDRAKIAIYDEDKIRPIPERLKRKYLMKSRDPKKMVYRIIPELREGIRFRRLNFMEGDFGFREPMDIIFCRNVIIYFDKPTQEKLLKRFCNCLSPDGFIFTGHSETLLGMDVPLVQVAPTIYRKAK